MKRIRWASLAARGDGCHVARSHYPPHRAPFGHGHDFAELCWIERGELVQDVPQRRDRLGPGGATLIRPDHIHTLSAGPRGVSLVNIAISAAHLGELEARYAGPGWPWHAAVDGGPAVHRMDAADLAEVTRRFESFARAGDDPLGRDAFLLDLLRRLRPGQHDPRWSDAPTWLAEALTRLAEPPLLGEGLAALPRLTGRSREHCSRTIRACCGRSAAEVVRDLRLEWAERALRLGQEPVGAIIEDCGYTNRTSFTRRFEERFGATPGAWRRQARLASG